MSFRLEHNPDPEDWRATWSLRPDRFPYDHLNYLDALGVEWASVVSDEVVLPFAFGRSAFGFMQVYCPLGAQRLGPMGAKAHDAKHVREALDALPRHARVSAGHDRARSRSRALARIHVPRGADTRLFKHRCRRLQCLRHALRRQCCAIGGWK